MPNPASLQELLAVEDHEGLLEYRCRDSGIPLWPLLRNRFLRAAISDAVFTRSLVAQRRGASLRRNAASAARAALQVAAHNAKHRGRLKGGILLTSGAAGLLPRNGAWFNRLTDHFAGLLPDETVILEDLFRWQLRRPRHAARVLYNTPYFLRTEASGWLRLRPHHLKSAAALVALVRGRALRLFGWELGDARAAAYARLLAREAAAIPAMRRAYASLLTDLGVRLLVKEMGCYGRSAVLIATAHDLGVAVAEHQHGLVSAGHDAYNLAPLLAASDVYRRTLPRHFLTYGAWWGEQISAPLESVPIGNPHRSEQLAGLRHVARNDREVLVLGDGIETRAYLELAGGLARRLAPRYEIVFRPHPHERDDAEVAAAESARQFRVDRGTDIYASLASAGAVVSEASTGLFEAIGLARRIVALESPRGRFSLPRHPFESARGVDELAQTLDGPLPAQPDERLASRIWSPGWQENYLAFVGQGRAALVRNAA